MIISVEDLKSQVDCGDMTDTAIQTCLNTIESVIRKYTHNNFQNRFVRFEAAASGNQINGTSPYIRVGDTIQITQSQVNDGLYVVTEVTEDHLTVDKQLFDVAVNRITKVEYPADVVQCAVKLFKWEHDFSDKVGIKSESETLSRHSTSVTYEDSSTLYMGYPTGLLSALTLNQKARCWK